MAHDPNIRQKAIDYYAAGATILEAAQSVNIAERTVARWVRDAGISRPAAPRRGRRGSHMWLPIEDIVYRGEWVRVGGILRGTVRDAS